MLKVVLMVLMTVRMNLVMLVAQNRQSGEKDFWSEKAGQTSAYGGDRVSNKC